LQNLRAETVCLADAAEVFDIDPRTFSGLIESGEVPAIRLRRKVLIPRRALLALLHLPDLTTDDAVEGVA
jgi:excisionase family DNA binding protein